MNTLRSPFASNKTYYFAYGSNMSRARLEKRIGEVNPCGIAALKDYQFCFNKRSKDGTGKANIIMKKNAVTHGVLFQVNHAQLKKLDPFEGAPHHYRRVQVSPTGKDGQTVRAITYIATNKWTSPHPLKPSREYLSHIRKGAKENQLPCHY